MDIFYLLCITGAGIRIQDNTSIYMEQGLEGLKSYLESKGGEGFWVSLTMGHHPSVSKGRSYVSGRQPNNGNLTLSLHRILPDTVYPFRSGLNMQ